MSAAAATGQLTGPELERYIRKVQQASFAGDTSDPQVRRYLESQIPEVTERYLANSDQALTDYRARLMANEAQVRLTVKKRF